MALKCNSEFKLKKKLMSQYGQKVDFISEFVICDKYVSFPDEDR